MHRSASLRAAVRKRILPAALVLLASGAAAGADDPAPGGTPVARPAPTMRDPGPDLGGDFPNGASVVPPGRLYLETGAFYGYTLAFGETRTSRADALLTAGLVRIGLVPRLELRLKAGLYGNYDQPDDPEAGTGPVQVGFKYRFFDGGASWRRPVVCFEFDAVLPIASSELDTGRVEPSAQFNLDHPLPAGFSFHWNAGVSTAVDADGDLFAQANVQWSVTKDVGEDFTVYLTGFFVDPDVKPGGGTEIVVGPGFRWFPDDRTSLQVTVAAGLQQQQNDLGIQVTLGFAF